MIPIPTQILVLVFFSGAMDFVVLPATISNSTVPAIVHAKPETPSSSACRSAARGSFKAFGGLLKAADASPPQTLTDDHGVQVDKASPSMPMTISGLNEVPDAGDKFYAVNSQKEAEAAAKERGIQERERELTREKVTLDNIFDQMKTADMRVLPVIVKGDVQGSVETLRSTISKIGNDEARIEIKHSAVGGINESDINLAETCGGIVVGFNTTSTAKSRRLAEDRGVEIRYYDVIYDLMDDLKKALEGLLDPEIKLEVIGHADVRDVFKISKVGMIAGCYVTDGRVERNQQIRVTRDGIVIESDRRLDQLKRFKDDSKEVKSGQECGMKISGYDDIKVGDVIECYKTLEVERTL